MNFRPLLLLSTLFLDGQNEHVIKQIQEINHQIYELKRERIRLHHKLYVESQNKVWRAANAYYSSFKNTSNTLPTFM